MISSNRPGGATVWFTGLPCAGKSTIAAAAAGRLLEVGPAGVGPASVGPGRQVRQDQRVEVLDGDKLRRTVSAGLGFSRSDREENVRRIGGLAEAAALRSADRPGSADRHRARADHGVCRGGLAAPDVARSGVAPSCTPRTPCPNPASVRSPVVREWSDEEGRGR